MPKRKFKLNGEIIQEAKIDQIESVLAPWLAQVESLEDGLAKFVGLMCKSLRCPTSQKMKVLQQARKQVQLVKNPDFKNFSGDLFFITGNALQNISQDEEALVTYDEAIEINPGFSDYWCNKSFVLRKLERYEEALESAEEAVSISPKNSSYWHNKSVALFELERYEEALESVEEAVSISPKNSSYWHNKSAVLINLERYEEALESVEEAISINPKNSSYWSNKGLVLTRIKEYDEALKSLDYAVNLSQDDSSWKLNRGILLAWMGQYQEAVKVCNDVLEQIPGNVDAFYAKACCYALQNDLENAVQNLEMAIAQETSRNIIKKRARRDPEFNNIRNENRFQILVNA
jgi:tetratricopeptide (TPR) repeat protein